MASAVNETPTTQRVSSEKVDSMTDSTGEKSKTTFLDLPLEIRTMIYEHILQENSAIPIQVIRHRLHDVSTSAIRMEPS